MARLHNTDKSKENVVCPSHLVIVVLHGKEKDDW